MVSHLLPTVLFGLALLALVIRLKTKKKRDFIISMSFVVLSSLVLYINLSGSVLLYFLGAAILSLIGDLLMAQWIRITEHRIIDGAIAFGLAHIVYTLGFNQLNRGWFTFSTDWWYLFVGLILILISYKYLAYNPKLHTAMKISNFIYVSIIVSLFIVVLGFVLFPTTPTSVRIAAFLGIVSFMVSDGVLAYNEFQKPIRGASDIIAVSYIIAQVLLQSVPLLLLIEL